MYGVTKATVTNFGESVFYELKENVDITVWEPGYIYTKILLEKPPSLMSLETSKAVSDALSKLGKERKTRGSLIFDMYPMSLEATPRTLRKAII